MNSITNFQLSKSNTLKADVVVIGSGAAGLMTVKHLDPRLNVLLISKNELTDCTTYHAQGGIACVVDQQDNPESHIQDTIFAGDNLCDHEAVRVLVCEGTEMLQELLAMVAFDTLPDKTLILAKEGAHSHR